MRVLRVADVERSHTAGVSGFMLASGEVMSRAGIEVSYLFKPDLLPGLSSAGLRRLLVPWVIAGRILMLRSGDGRPDVVEIHEPSAAVYAWLARAFGPRAGLPACVVLSHGLEVRGWRAKLAMARAYGRPVSLKSRIAVPLTLLSQAGLGLRAARVAIVLSSEDERHLIQQVGLSPARVVRGITGVDAALFDVGDRAREPGRILFLGSWLDRKGVAELSRAWPRVVAESPNARLTIAGVGDSPEAAEFAATSRGVELVEHVERAELSGLLASHSVFVLPSWFEGMPLAMLEAAAAGLACVVSAVCGNLDVFRPPSADADGGLLVAPGHADALADTILRLVADPDYAALLGARASTRARDFTLEAAADRLIAAYEAASTPVGSAPRAPQAA